MSALQSGIAFVGGVCTAIVALAGAVALYATIVERRSRQPLSLREENRNARIGGIFVILAAALMALLTSLAVRWAG